MTSLDSDLAARFPNLDAQALQEIVSTDLGEDALNNYLKMAFYTTRPLAGKLGACGGKSAEEMIVKALAAHYLTMTEQQPQRMTSGEWSVTYRGESGEGLKASTFGQQALALDCTGTLTKIAERPRVARLVTIGYNDFQSEDSKAVI